MSSFPDPSREAQWPANLIPASVRVWTATHYKQRQLALKKRHTTVTFHWEDEGREYHTSLARVSWVSCIRKTVGREWNTRREEGNGIHDVRALKEGALTKAQRHATNSSACGTRVSTKPCSGTQYHSNYLWEET